MNNRNTKIINPGIAKTVDGQTIRLEKSNVLINQIFCIGYAGNPPKTTFENTIDDLTNFLSKPFQVILFLNIYNPNHVLEFLKENQESIKALVEAKKICLAYDNTIPAEDLRFNKLQSFEKELKELFTLSIPHYIDQDKENFLDAMRSYEAYYKENKVKIDNLHKEDINKFLQRSNNGQQFDFGEAKSFLIFETIVTLSMRDKKNIASDTLKFIFHQGKFLQSITDVLDEYNASPELNNRHNNVRPINCSLKREIQKSINPQSKNLKGEKKRPLSDGENSPIEPREPRAIERIETLTSPTPTPIINTQQIINQLKVIDEEASTASSAPQNAGTNFAENVFIGMVKAGVDPKTFAYYLSCYEKTIVQSLIQQELQQQPSMPRVSKLTFLNASPLRDQNNNVQSVIAPNTGPNYAR